MVETIIAFAIIGGVLFLAGRSMYRIVAGKQEGCGCGSCSLSEGCRNALGNSAEQDDGGT